MPSEERRKKNRQPKSGHGVCDPYKFGSIPVVGVLQADFQFAGTSAALHTGLATLFVMLHPS